MVPLTARCMGVGWEPPCLGAADQSTLACSLTLDMVSFVALSHQAVSH